MTTITTTEQPMTTMKIKSDSTIGSQITRAKALMDKGKLCKQFNIKGIGSKAGTTAIIVGRNLGAITDFNVEPYTTPQGHRSLQVSISVDTECRPDTTDLTALKFWNVCVPDPDRGQTIASSCRALDAKLENLDVDETIVIRGASLALNVMVVFYSYINTDWPGCKITTTQIKNNIIENRETGRKNKKTLMSFVVKRNYWEDESDEEEEEQEDDDEAASDKEEKDTQ